MGLRGGEGVREHKVRKKSFSTDDLAAKIIIFQRIVLGDHLVRHICASGLMSKFL